MESEKKSKALQTRKQVAPARGESATPRDRVKPQEKEAKRRD